MLSFFSHGVMQRLISGASAFVRRGRGRILDAMYWKAPIYSIKMFRFADRELKKIRVLL